MTIEHKDILDMHDRAYSRGQVTRERAADDLVFANVTQWDDSLLSGAQLQYRGEFNIIRKARRQIMAQLAANSVQVDFEPVGDNYELSDFMDGLYRTTTRRNVSMESFSNANQEAIDCGFGAWKLENVEDGPDNRQIIQRTPIFEANNTLYWDPDAKLIDKSDATYCSLLTRYTEKGLKRLIKSIKGKDVDVGEYLSSFKYPEESYVFPWVAEDEKYYVGEFYHRRRVDETIHVFIDLYGEEKEVTDKEMKDQEDELFDSGFSYYEEIKRTKYEVTRYLVTGHDILEETVIPGEHIPVVPEYGERAVVEGEEHYEGITRLAKDPQRLRNFQLSYLADIMSRSPREKPIFYPEQIQGYEHMYEDAGSENNFPYLLMHRTSADGRELPPGPPGMMPSQPIPDALAQSVPLAREAVEDVANPGLPQDIADPDLSGKAVSLLQRRMDMQTSIYNERHKTALRRDAEIFASMAPQVYDSPRQVTLTLVDGQRKTERMMETRLDEQSMEIVMDNDIRNARFEVYAEIGESYATQKEEVRAEIKEIMASLPPGTEEFQIMLLKYTEMLPGSDMDDMRRYASRKLIDLGIKEPETEEEIAYVQEQQQLAQQQQEQPDPAMLIAQAELGKAEAEQANAQVKQFDAESKRIKVGLEAEKLRVDAQQAGISMDKVAAETRKIQVDTGMSLVDSTRRLRAPVGGQYMQ